MCTQSAITQRPEQCGGAALLSAIQRSVLCALVCLAVLCGPAIQAQMITGSVSGSVRDSSGASVAGTPVKLVNSGTGAVQQVNTDEAGNFRFLLLLMFDRRLGGNSLFESQDGAIADSAQTQSTTSKVQPAAAIQCVLFEFQRLRSKAQLA